ncbi:MAG TPA: penicillin-binding transpeptidase domain-containing protein [Ignavibacteria bacterium]|nr:penicillin-binding transpeptidase domain-containing protein [Ignavibacteria bacterium]
MYFLAKKNTDNKINPRRRVNIVLFCLIILFGIIFYRLLQVQVIDSAKYKLAAKKQYETKVILYPSRGLIFDRNMNLMVSNSFQFSIAADPNMIDNKDSVASVLASRLKNDKQIYLDKLNTPNSSFVYIEKKLMPEAINGLDTLDINGLIVLKEPVRVYNYNSLASQILGFTNTSNQGLSGIELAMNKELAGKEGYMIMKRDGKGNKRPDNDYPGKDPEKGNDLVLTVDINIQKILEEELSNAVIGNNATNGKGVILNVKTGEVLAISSFPTFNPNDIKTHDSVGMKNTVITDIFEPGSTYKLITVAASLEENLESPSSIIATEQGQMDINGNRITDSYASTNMTFKQAIENSSNVAMMKIAKKIGNEKFYKYSRDFGFGIYSGIDLPGENRGSLKRPMDFSSGSLEYMSIGYQVAINTMQLACAYSTVANNGLMMKPFVLKREIGNDGKINFENKPVAVRQVISEKTAKTLTSLLTGVVEQGTATDAGIEGVRIAGKTGTSQKIVNGKYSSNSHTSSFVGYLPAENPVLLIAIVLDDPKAGQYYGGKVSAPVFKNIAQRILSYKNIEELNFDSPQFGKDDVILVSNDKSLNEILVPDLTGKKLGDAIDILNHLKIKYELSNDNLNNNGVLQKIIEFQSPAANSYSQYNGLVLNLTLLTTVKPEVQFMKVPDVTNLSVRKAVNLLVSKGYKVEIQGSGKVIQQIPQSGSELKNGEKIIILCNNDI